MENPWLDVTVLLTREEHIRLSQQLSRREGLSIRTALGAMMIALGLLTLGLGENLSLPSWVCAALAFGGLALILWELIAVPTLTVMNEIRKYDENPETIPATRIAFDETAVLTENARVQAELPMTAMTAWRDTGEFIVLFFGKEARVTLPRRALTPKQAEELCRYLRKRP